MADREYTPFADRTHDQSLDAHESLPDAVRERLLTRTKGTISCSKKLQAIKTLTATVGRDALLEDLRIDSVRLVDPKVFQRDFLRNADTALVLTYLEVLVEEVHLGELQSNQRRFLPSKNDVEVSTETEPLEQTANLIEDLRDAFAAEEVPWELQMAGRGGVIEFVPSESAPLGEAE